MQPGILRPVMVICISGSAGLCLSPAASEEFSWELSGGYRQQDGTIGVETDRYTLNARYYLQPGHVGFMDSPDVVKMLGRNVNEFEVNDRDGEVGAKLRLFPTSALDIGLTFSRLDSELTWARERVEVSWTWFFRRSVAVEAKFARTLFHNPVFADRNTWQAESVLVRLMVRQ